MKEWNTYVCPLCTFVVCFQKTFTHFNCPSCKVVVQAIEWKEEEPKTEMPPREGGVH